MATRWGYARRRRQCLFDRHSAKGGGGAATQGSIRMKRTRCGELETVVRRGKDAFVSASSSCEVTASFPFPGATTSPPRYRRLLFSFPFWCLILSPTPSYHVAAYKDYRENCIYQLLTSQLLHQHGGALPHCHRYIALLIAPLPQPCRAADAAHPPTT